MICSWCSEIIEKKDSVWFGVDTTYHTECKLAANRSKMAPLNYWGSDFDRMRGEDLFERKNRREKLNEKSTDL